MDAPARDALGRLFVGSGIGQGYLGDEDNGAMSAWQIFGALGFDPLRVGSASYVVGSPLFTKATVHLENGRGTGADDAPPSQRAQSPPSPRCAVTIRSGSCWRPRDSSHPQWLARRRLRCRTHR